MSPLSMAPRIAYRHEASLYLNITNRCPVACRFCAKYSWDWRYRGSLLRLAAEPSAEEVVGAACRGLDEKPAASVVFCGFGEPTERLAVVVETAVSLRAAKPGVKLRLNTIGLGSLSHGRDIVPELAASLDAVSVSLNTADARQWARLHRPRPALAEAGFSAVCAFIRRCAQSGLETTVTAVALPEVDLVKVEILARSLGARFRLRPELL